MSLKKPPNAPSFLSIEVSFFLFFGTISFSFFPLSGLKRSLLGLTLSPSEEEPSFPAAKTGSVTSVTANWQSRLKSPSKDTSNLVSSSSDRFFSSDDKFAILIPPKLFPPTESLNFSVFRIFEPIKFSVSSKFWFRSIKFLLGTKSLFVIGTSLLTITDGRPRINSYRWSESFDSSSQETFCFLPPWCLVSSPGSVTTRVVFATFCFFSFFTVAAKAVLFPPPPFGPLWLYLQLSAYLQKPFPLAQLWQGSFDVSTSAFLFPRFLCVAPPFPFPPCLGGLGFFVPLLTFDLNFSGAPFHTAAFPAVHLGSPLI